MSICAKGLATILICSTIFALLSLPLILGKVPPNGVYGYRTPATLADEALWYDANAYFGRRCLLASLLSACAARALYAWQDLSPEACLPVSVVLLGAPVAVAGGLTARFVRSTQALSRSASESR
jgi:uncharacterized membrane protein